MSDLDPAHIGKRRCEAKTCQWGVMSVRCGAPAVTTRPRPSGHGLNARRWDVCQKHADFLDRLRKNITDHAPLLRRLRDEKPVPCPSTATSVLGMVGGPSEVRCGLLAGHNGPHQMHMEWADQTPTTGRPE